jgi:ketosteroid isomerase-like protein
MIKRLSAILTLSLAIAGVSFAQNANTTTMRPAPGAQEEAGAQDAPATARSRRARSNQTGGDANRGVLAAFNALLDGIRQSNVNAVTSIYWNSPQLLLFNNNGTVTRGWEQMRQNRASSYPNMKDVKLEVRDVQVQMLGREGAIVTCLWTQSQTFRDTPETATGRMTLVFRSIGGAWKAIHLHTSPDKPDPSRLFPSEQTETPTPTPTPSATPKPKTTP